MSRRHVPAAIPLVASLAAIAAAADQPLPVNRPNPIGGAAISEYAPGRSSTLGGQRQVIVQGDLDLDAITQDNYRDGDQGLGDHRGRGLIRCDFGLKMTLDDKVKVQLILGYHGEAGGVAANSPVDGPAPGSGQSGNQGPNGFQDRNGDARGAVVLQQAFVRLQDVLGFNTVTAVAGRMPESFWIHQDLTEERYSNDKKRAMLFDSRADDRDLTSWDGFKASYSGFDTWQIIPFVYCTPDASGLYGVAVDWRPMDTNANQQLVLSGSWNVVRNVPIKSGFDANGQIVNSRGKNLTTWYGGADYKSGGFSFFGEIGYQSGNQGNGEQFAGRGATGGVEWQFGPNSPVTMGLLADYFSGDSNSGDGKNSRFINPYEHICDTYIVENEKYGELSRYMDGDLQALKVKLGVRMANDNSVRMDAVWGGYRLDSAASAQRYLGQEVDLTISWRVSYDARLSLLGGVFFPGPGFKLIAPNNPLAPGESAGNSPVYLAGVNLKVAF